MTLSIAQAREWYTDNDTVHDFEHVLRVLRMAERIGKAEGADLEIIRAAALLHDSKGAAPGGDGSERQEHHLTSAVFAGEVLQAESWAPERIRAVQHCIRSHRFRAKDEQPETLEARCLFDADKLDVLGAIGVARTIAYATLEGQPAFAEPSSKFLESRELEEGEPYSSYHEYLFKLRQVKDRLLTRTGQSIAAQRAAFLDAFYEQLRAESSGER